MVVPSIGGTADMKCLQRLGFRRAPPLGNCLENFLPAIVQQAAARGHLSPTDIFDGFLAGHLAEDDNASDAGMFTYSWKRGQAKLDVSIAWRRQHVAAVATNAWIARCVVARELPFEVCYYIKNRTEASMECRWRVHPGRSHEMQAIPAGGVRAGFIRIADPPRRLSAGATVDLELAGTSVSFRMRRFRPNFREQPNAPC